jgi:hypothetical protein
MDKNKVIKKLKDIKDPQERDRIIWALAGKEKDVLSDKPASLEPRTAPLPPPGQAQKLPGLPGDARKLIGYVFPGIFIFFGLVNLVQAAMQYHFTGQIEDVIPRLIMGGLLVLFGIFGIVKAKRQVQGGDADQKEA